MGTGYRKCESKPTSTGNMIARGSKHRRYCLDFQTSRAASEIVEKIRFCDMFTHHSMVLYIEKNSQGDLCLRSDAIKSYLAAQN